MQIRNIATCQIQTACIGFGIAGQSHVFDLVTNHQYTLKGVVSKSKKTNSKISSIYPFNSAYSNLEALFNDSHLELLVIATPNSVAPELVFRALQKKMKVLVEKPFIVYQSHYFKIISSFPDAENSISILYNRRFKKGWREAKEIISSNQLGNILGVSFKCFGPYKNRFSATAVSFRSSKLESVGGIILDTCSHILDSILFLFENIGEIEKVDLSIEPSTNLEFEAFIVINQMEKFKIYIEVLNHHSDEENKTIEINGENGTILIDDRSAIFKINNETREYLDNYLIRPCEDGINLIQNNPIYGTKLSEGKIISERINDIYRISKYPFKMKWKIPRAKVLGKRSGAC